MHLRTSLASRLLLGGLVFTILLIVGVSGFLLISRKISKPTPGRSPTRTTGRAWPVKC